MQAPRLRVLTQMALGELPLTDGPCRIALSACAMRMHDVSILDVLWERMDSL